MPTSPRTLSFRLTNIFVPSRRLSLTLETPRLPSFMVISATIVALRATIGSDLTTMVRETTSTRRAASTTPSRPSSSRISAPSSYPEARSNSFYFFYLPPHQSGGSPWRLPVAKSLSVALSDPSVIVLMPFLWVTKDGISANGMAQQYCQAGMQISHPGEPANC